MEYNSETLNNSINIIETTIVILSDFLYIKDLLNKIVFFSKKVLMTL